MSNKYRLIIRHRWALGDTVLLTALVRDIHRAYPGKYEIMVDTNWTNVWWNNPHVVRFEEKGMPRPTKVEVGWGDAIKWNSYARIGDEKHMRHILAWYHYDFEKKTGIHVPVTEPKPDLYMSAEELKPRLQGRYWVILSGGKLDLTNKHWHAQRIQETVDELSAKGLNFVQCGATHSLHVHPPIDGALNMIGQTDNVRDFWNIIKHSEGVICPVTGAMHIAAAFEKPCVVLGGGREEPWFEAYVDNFEAFGPGCAPVKTPHKFLHTIGLLPCCDVQGCWKKRVVPIDQDDLTRKAYTLCRDPVRPKGSHAVAHCMDLIKTEHVVRAVMDYYDKKVLPPIDLDIEPIKEVSPAVEQRAAESGPPKIIIPKVQIRKAPVLGGKVKIIREPSVDSRNQKPHQKVHPKEATTDPVEAPKPMKIANIDHPIIGGKITVCVLCYGDHYDNARKCLESVLATVPVDKIDLRVGGNELGQETLQYLETLPITKKYLHSNNAKKYPVMRKMFWDNDCPLNTPYVVWFDDDTIVKDPTWLDTLCNTIVANHNQGFRMYGAKMFHDISMYNKQGHRPDLWFRSADWFRGVSFRARGSNHTAPNGSIIDFAVGWFWALHTDVIRASNIPDTRLNHNGGDITIGAQVHQAGFKIQQFNKGKVFISTPKKEQGGRRVGGYEESFPWVDPASKFSREYRP